MRFLFSFFIVSIILVSTTVVFSQNFAIRKSDNKVIIAEKQYYLHEVEAKQTIFAISKIYNVGIDDILKTNDKETTDLQQGEVLKIPAEVEVPTQFVVNTDFEYHTVQNRETLYGLSKKYDVSIDQLLKLNPRSAEFLKAGERIKIPVLSQKSNVAETSRQKQLRDYYDHNYYYHYVKKGETQFSIARKFGLKVKKVQRWNKWMKKTVIREGSKIRIPRRFAKNEIAKLEMATLKEKQLRDAEEKARIEKELAEKNAKKKDTPDEGIDTVFKPPQLKYRYTIVLFFPVSKSDIYLRRYQGMLLAAENFGKKSAVNIDFHVFDPQGSQAVVSRILNKPVLNNADLIIGPYDSKLFDLVAKYAQRKKIPIVALSAKCDDVLFQPNVIQLNTSFASLAEKMAAYIVNNYEFENILYPKVNLFTKLDTSQHFKNKDEKIAFFTKEIKDFLKKEDFDHTRDYMLLFNKLLDQHQKNIVIAPHLKSANVSRILSTLNASKEKKEVLVFGMPVWQHYESLDPELFYLLNVSYFSPFDLDYNNPEVINIITQFRKKFSAEPHILSFRTYDTVWFLMNALEQYGTGFIYHLNDVHTPLINSEFRFEKHENGGYENQQLYKVTFKPSFKVESGLSD